MSEIKPVAYIHTPFSSKFGIPRQSGLTSNEAKIVFVPEFRSEDAIRGLEGFSHLWLIWEFSLNKNKSSSLTVRPPRLGGNSRMGVFATRSSFRPNNLGLSSVEIIRTELDPKDGPVIYVKGADILDGTPLFDIKPYLPFTDCHPDARGGFADSVSEYSLFVVFPPELSQIAPENDIEVITDILSQDPRPHYQNDPERIYSFEYSHYNIKFTVSGNTLTVCAFSDITEA